MPANPLAVAPGCWSEHRSLGQITAAGRRSGGTIHPHRLPKDAESARARLVARFGILGCDLRQRPSLCSMLWSDTFGAQAS